MRETDQAILSRLLEAYPPDLRGEVERHVAAGDGRPPAQALLEAGRVREALAAIDEEEREFLALAARQGGEVTPGAADWWLRHRGVGDPSRFVESLAARGLLFYQPAGGRAPRAAPLPADRAHEPRGVWIAGKLWVPEAIGGQAAERCPVRPLAIADEPREVRRAAPWDILRQLFVLMRYLDERKPRVLSTAHGIGDADLVGLAEALGERPPARKQWRTGHAKLRWLECLALQTGLAEERERRLAPSPRASDFFETAPRQQRRLLLEAAVTQTRWGELEAEPALMVEAPSAVAPGQGDIPSPGGRVRARRHVLRVLTEAAIPGQWHRLPEFAERLMETAPDFLVRRRLAPRRGHVQEQSAEPLYRGIEEATPGGPRPVGMWSGWMLVEGAFAARFVTGVLQWLGLVEAGEVDPAATGPHGSGCFRLTEEGAAALGMVEREEEARPAGRFFVQPDFEIMADAGGESIDAVARLSRVAELMSLDRAALLKITRESVVRALDSGLTGQQVLGILSDDGRVQVPQNVAYSVREWATAHDRYELRTEAWIIETGDAEELSALEAELPGCLDRLGPRAARVLPGERGRVTEALARRPAVLPIDHGQGLSEVFALDDRMMATPIPERWHWYAEHLLSQIAQRQGDRSRESGDARTKDGDDTGRAAAFRLTRESVREGLARGLQAAEIERFVRACAAGELGPEQGLLLRGWLGRYEAVHLTSATVLALPPDAVKDVLAIGEIREQIVGWLGPAVFIVRPSGRAKVKRWLEKAGITIEAELPARPPMDSPLREGEGEARYWGRRRWQAGDPEPERTAALEEAIRRGLRVEVEYQSVVRDEPPRRWVLSPRSIERSRWGQVRLHAYCHQRETDRVFEVARMSEVRVLD